MVIGKIREKSTLLLIMIGGAMLAFILGDLFSSGGFLLNGSPTEIGEIAGTSIDGRKFEVRLQEAIDNYKTQSGQSTVDAATTDQLRDQTWNQMIREIVLGQELDATGVTVSADELYDMIQGSNPHPQVVQAFTNPQTGQFDPSQVSGFLRQMESDPDLKKRWISFEKDIAQLRRNEKYNNLIKKGLYVTSAEAKSNYMAKNAPADISYVLKRYSAVPDSSVTVSDADIKKYYEAHKSEYKQEASRDLEFVSFPVTPSKDDYEKVENWAQRIKPEFATTENDTLFVTRESDVRFNARWQPKGSLPTNIDSIMFEAEKGYVHGPYLENQTFRLAKLIGIKMAPDSVNARHILLRPETYGSYEALKAAADSIFDLVKNGADFAAMAREVSEDPGSGAQGGELGWFQEGQMVPTFNTACFDGDEGDLTMVESQFGFHIIEVLEQKGNTEKRAVAFVDRRVEPSTKTFQIKYGEADEFKRSITSIASFDQEVANRELNKRIASNLKENDRTIAGLQNPRQLIRWAYEAEKGDVSDVIELGNNFVIGVLTNISEEGYTPMDEIKEELRTKTIQEKKAQRFMEEFQNAKADDIQTIADNMNLPLESKQRVLFSANSISGLGRELALIGTVSALEQGEISEPVKGDQGVYVIRLDSRSDASEMANYRNNASVLQSGLSSRVEMEVFNALKEKAEIVDNRSKFF